MILYCRTAMPEPENVPVCAVRCTISCGRGSEFPNIVRDQSYLILQSDIKVNVIFDDESSFIPLRDYVFE